MQHQCNKIRNSLYIKEVFGWASVDMVSVYDDLTAKDKIWTELSNLTDSLDRNKTVVKDFCGKIQEILEGEVIINRSES